MEASIEPRRPLCHVVSAMLSNNIEAISLFIA
jgi:hypothetical protein